MPSTLTTILAELRTEICKAVLSIVDLLKATASDVRQASVNALCKFGEHRKSGLLKCPHH